MRIAFFTALAWALVLPAVLAAPAPAVDQAAKDWAAIQAAGDHPALRSRAIKGTPAKGGRRRKDPPEKYFHESTFHPHYDGRFASKEVPYAERKTALIALVRSYLTSMNEIGIQTWIMHGSLLGWWWNKRIMPWDTDLDVMVSEQAMEHLASYYNMTIHHHRYDDGETGRDYMLEINPHFRNVSEADRYNRIDARWVDVKTGLFIDITTLHHNKTAEAEGKVGAMMSKDKHHYDIKDIFPLRETVFEDTPCLVPYGYTELLIEEYGPMSLIKRDFANHHFDQLTMEWLPVVNPKPEKKKVEDKKAEDKKAEEKKAAAAKTASSSADAKPSQAASQSLASSATPAPLAQAQASAPAIQIASSAPAAASASVVAAVPGGAVQPPAGEAISPQPQVQAQAPAHS